ncbi:3-deoxy-7-phosphoheptulonate synthase [Thermoflavimicrobium dichotomicum]|uniref:3-deoxy-D-arabinoheptulosonate-7-phosphate synthase n=1 Tax=Thermoflavimicrobium dichotomicum TaxID=46223 RepID=A0A1I3U3T3_9BACL|nr:3-deoxy-7-phosphoheptulonate synthase [Thermoflavimicrobium dichotomicum]SFJ77403.1 3-deoxy-D-arabinoheptulosonate-7-phosphate synthase [Thermoflavimicrobium dichotomicum]
MIIEFIKSENSFLEEIKERLDKEGIKSVVNTAESKICLLTQPESTDLIYTLIDSRKIKDFYKVKYPFKLASRQFKSGNTVVKVNENYVGNGKPVFIAGPCAVESEQQLMVTAEFLASLGVNFLRGGAFKPRTSPYSFQGLGEEGLKILYKAKLATGLSIVSEVVNVEDVEVVAEYCDVLQIGTRNMYNYPLLKKVAKTNKPILLKRGFSATIDEWLLAAEYILSEGNFNVILCERGIRANSKYTRNLLDISAVPIIKELSHLPIIIDPSHAVGVTKYIPPVSKAALAVGSDGLIIEVHPNPEQALSDGQQSLNFEQFKRLYEQFSVEATNKVV